ncbi:MAG: SRPBCC family protein [Desulfobacterales bacterium]|nr:SRPBCC family protein [Desulfobacterales bacterium]
MPASAQRVWDLLTDTDEWPRWGPTVTGVRSSERFIVEGSRGRVRTPIGVWLPFTVTAYEHLSCWGWRVAGIEATGHRLTALGPDSCEVVFELPLCWGPNAFICRRAARNLARLSAPGRS